MKPTIAPDPPNEKPANPDHYPVYPEDSQRDGPRNPYGPH